MAHPALTLYYSPGACSLAVRILLHELSLPFSATEVALGSEVRPVDGSLTAAEYRAQVHHAAVVPGFVLSSPSTGERLDSITEMPAILAYLGTLVAEDQAAPWFGATPLDKVKVQSWLAWLAGALHGQAYGPYFFPRRFIAGEEGWERVKAQGLVRVKERYESIEKRLPEDGSYFLGGSEPTVVDVVGYVFWRWGFRYLEGADMSLYPRYGALCKRIQEREMTKKALAEEGLKTVGGLVPVV